MDSKIKIIPIDHNLRNNILQKHDLDWRELIRLEAMSRFDLNGISTLREWLQDEFHHQTSILLERGFLIWDENARLCLSSKSVKIVSLTNQPIWIN
jgi:hypothetical protein